MNKFFLSLIICFAVVHANEDKPGTWDTSGFYVKTGVGMMPPIPYGAFGLGLYYKFQRDEALDFSVMVDTSGSMGGFCLLHNSLDVKLLFLPKPGKKIQIGIGPVYLKDMGIFAWGDSLGVAVLFRKVNPEKKGFFQVEISQPLFALQEQGGSVMGCEGGINLGGANFSPRINLMFGRRF